MTHEEHPFVIKLELKIEVVVEVVIWVNIGHA